MFYHLSKKIQLKHVYSMAVTGYPLSIIEYLIISSYISTIISRYGRRSLEKKNQERISWHKRSHLWLKPFCDPNLDTMLCPWTFFVTLWTVASGSYVHGVFQPRILEWVATPFSRGSSRPRDQIQRQFLYCLSDQGSSVLEYWLNWKSLSHVRLFATLWIIQSMKFSRPEYCSG